MYTYIDSNTRSYVNTVLQCLNGTQRIDEKCVMCDNARAPNSTWLVDCEWCGDRGERDIHGQTHKHMHESTHIQTVGETERLSKRLVER